MVFEKKEDGVGGLVTRVFDGKVLEKLKMIIVSTNKKRDCSALVEKVRNLKNTSPDVFENTMGALRDCTESLIEELFPEEKESTLDHFAILDLISTNQQLLQEIGVSSPSIDQIVSTLMQHNIHGKLTGAGGEGGCVLGFYMPGSVGEEELKTVEIDLNKQGFSLIPLEKSTISPQGLIL